MNGTVHAPNSGFVTFDAYSGGGGEWERERGGEEGEREMEGGRKIHRETETDRDTERKYRLQS